MNMYTHTTHMRKKAFQKKSWQRASKVAHLVGTLITKRDGLSSVPGAHMIEGKNQLFHFALWPPQACCGLFTHECTLWVHSHTNVRHREKPWVSKVCVDTSTPCQRLQSLRLMEGGKNLPLVQSLRGNGQSLSWGTKCECQWMYAANALHSLPPHTGLNSSSLKMANLQRVPRLSNLPPRSHKPHLLVYLYVFTLSMHPAVCNSPAYVQLYTIKRLSFCGATFSPAQSLNRQIPAFCLSLCVCLFFIPLCLGQVHPWNQIPVFCLSLCVCLLFIPLCFGQVHPWNQIPAFSLALCVCLFYIPLYLSQVHPWNHDGWNTYTQIINVKE